MEYLPHVPLHYQHVARHARSILGMPVILCVHSGFADRKYHVRFQRGGAKKPIIGSS